MSLIQNMWNYKHNDTDFTTQAMSTIVKLMKSSTVCFDFFYSMPSLTYNYIKLLDFFHSYTQMLIRREKADFTYSLKLEDLQWLDTSFKLLNRREPTVDEETQREKYREIIGLNILKLAEEGKRNMLNIDYDQKMDEVKFLEYQPKIIYCALNNQI